jgi:hypothetical protein
MSLYEELMDASVYASLEMADMLRRAADFVASQEDEDELLENAPDLLNALKNLTSAFLSHTNWNGDLPSEIIEANAAIAIEILAKRQYLVGQI